MLLTVVIVVFAGLTMVALAGAMTFVLGWANQAFYVYVDPRIEAVDHALPGANCGGCGYVGCREYAVAVVEDGIAVNKCTVGGESVARKLAEILDVEVEQTWPYRAVVHCAAETEDRLQRMPYNGEPTCGAANVISGVQGCIYGCLGLGDCVTACDYDAIHIVNGLAVVDYEKCTGCRACAEVCPRNIISMVPFKADRMLVVACSNKDFGKDVREVCTVGCIGCKQCEKVSDLIRMEDNLAILDYGQYDPGTADFTSAIDKCPMESLLFVGKPSKKDREDDSAGEMPERIEADFKTSVDQTSWWG